MTRIVSPRHVRCFSGSVFAAPPPAVTKKGFLSRCSRDSGAPRWCKKGMAELWTAIRGPSSGNLPLAWFVILVTDSGAKISEKRNIRADRHGAFRRLDEGFLQDE